MSWLQQKYIGLMSNQFDLFKKKADNLYNFRCPECGDSSKNRFKARGYLYQRNNGWFFKCHNCGYSVSFENFIKKHSPILYKEYSLELISEGVSKGSLMDFVEEPPKEQVHVKGLWPLKKLKKISQLHHDHPAKKYIASRKIPNPYHAKLYYADNFAEWVNSMLPDKMNTREKEGRIVIPLINNQHNLIGFQGRSLKKDGLRYITIMLDPTEPKIFGLDSVNSRKHIYVFEGPFDSMFIDNSIAVCGSDLIPVLNRTNMDKNKITIVFDNERRNDQIIKKVDSAIEQGYNVCLWPSNIRQKDVNDMIMEGKNVADIKLIIDENSFRGLSAKLALSAFRR